MDRSQGRVGRPTVDAGSDKQTLADGRNFESKRYFQASD